MRFFIIFAFVILAALPVRAADLVIVNPKTSVQSGGISGKITRIKKESLKIETARGDDFEIELDDIDLDGRARNLFQVGQNVFVQGIRTDDDEIRASRITVNETGRVFDTGRRVFFGDLIVK